MDVQRGINPQWGRLGRGVGSWTLGRGLLSLHVGAYLLTATALILLNLTRSPNDLWFQDPLRRWGVFVVLHAALVVGGWTAWHVSRWSRRRSQAETVAEAVVPVSAGRFSRYRTGAPTPPSAAPAGSLPVRLRTTAAKVTARVQTVQVGPSVEAQLARLPDLWQRRSVLLASGLTRATGLAARGRASAETALHRVRGQKPTASWPTQPQWPAPDGYDRNAPEWATPFDDRSQANDLADGVPAPRFTATTRSAVEQSPEPDQAATFPAPSFYSFPPPTTTTDPLSGDEVSPVPEPPAATPPLPAKPGAEWSWVEAAAATWLARRDADDDEPRP